MGMSITLMQCLSQNFILSIWRPRKIGSLGQMCRYHIIKKRAQRAVFEELHTKSVT